MDMDLADLYRTIVETSADGIWVLDLDGRTIFANPQIARIHGIPVEDLPSLTVHDILDEDGQDQFRRHLDGVRDSGEIHEGDVEVQWVRRDGSVTWTLASETALRDDQGRIQALLHRHSPYAERRELIESLRAHEVALADEIAQNQLLQAIASTANHAATMSEVLVHGRDLVLLHDDWERARAFVPESLESTTLVPFYAFEDDREADRDDPFAETELALAQRSADERQMAWDDRKLSLALPVLLDDEVYAVIVITSAPPLFRFELIETMARQVAQQLSRVAERERAQAMLAHARDEAMEASRLKSEFLATMSHEIRTPLNGVIGLNDLLLRTDLDEEQTRLVTGLQVSGRALLGLINDILDFSKIEAGRLDLEEIAFDVRELMEHIHAVQTGTAEKKGIALSVAYAPDVPVAASGDPTKIAQVVTNLVSNALKFTAEGAVAVLVDAESIDQGEVVLRVEVRDTGTGVPPDRLAQLFEPFTQADSSTTRLYGGTGLGLAISRELVTAMNGEITHAPNPAGGSIFTATFRLRQAVPGDVVEVPAAVPRLEHAGPPDKGVVLVVEDNPVNQLVATGLLTALGYGVVTADDGQAGVDAAAEGGFVAVLMDIQMPVLDGYSAARAIRAAETGSRVPIIAMTAAAVAGVHELCLEAGMDDFLTKPVDVDRLAATVDRWRIRSAIRDAEGAPRLDLVRLEELRELDSGSGETSYVARAIANLLASAPRDLETLAAAAAHGDEKQLAAVAHRLAGALLNLGAPEGGEVARRLENGESDLSELVPVVTGDMAALAAYRAAIVS
jgi:PAS domain S-box-containing protein